MSCPYCPATIRTKADLDRHMEINHKELNNFNRAMSEAKKTVEEALHVINQLRKEHYGQ